MGPGLPGFGIASLFYIGAALVGPFRELVLTLRGRSNRRRWSTAVTQFFIAAAMIAALVVFYLGLAAVIRSGWLPVRSGTTTLIPVPNWAVAAMVMVVVLAVGSIWGAVAGRLSSDDDPNEVAAGHRAGVAGIVLDLRGRSDATPPRRSRRWNDVVWPDECRRGGDSDLVAAALLASFPIDHRHARGESDLIAFALMATFPVDGQLISSN